MGFAQIQQDIDTTKTQINSLKNMLAEVVADVIANPEASKLLGKDAKKLETILDGLIAILKK